MYVDSYQNMTIKTMQILTWYTTHCNEIPLLLKTDDDMFINTKNLFDFASEFDVESTSLWNGLITGHMHKNRTPFRDPDNKYYVPEEIYPHKIYPQFISGGAYLISRNINFNIAYLFFTFGKAIIRSTGRFSMKLLLYYQSPSAARGLRYRKWPFAKEQCFGGLGGFPPL